MIAAYLISKTGHFYSSPMTFLMSTVETKESWKMDKIYIN